MERLRFMRFMLVPALLLALLGWLHVPRAGGIDSGGASWERAYEHIRELASPAYGGRAVGTEGNRRAVSYVLDSLRASGLQPLPGHSYRMPFRTLVPVFDQAPLFRYTSRLGETVSFKAYEDYRMYASGIGGGLDYTGDLLFVDTRLYDIPPALLAGRVIIMTSATLNQEAAAYAQSHGALGLFSYIYNFGVDTDAAVRMKGTGAMGKQGPVMGLGVLSRQAFSALRLEALANPLPEAGAPRGGAVVGLIPGAEVRQGLRFEVAEADNVVAMIPGRKRDAYLLIGAHLDHVGTGPEGRSFPGALDNASGTALLLELARLCGTSGAVPEKTLLFVAWNGEENGLKGSSDFVAHPPVPLERTEVINLDMLGGIGQGSIQIGAGNEASKILASRLIQAGEDLGLPVTAAVLSGSDHVPFAEAGGRAVMVHQGDRYLHQQKDDLQNIDQEHLKNAVALMGAVLAREAYGSTYPDYLSGAERWALSLFIGVMGLVYGVETWWRRGPGVRFFGLQAETVYFSTAYRLLRPLLWVTVPATILLLLIFISQLPRDLDLMVYKGQWETNFSGYLAMKHTWLYVRSVLTQGLGTTAGGGDVAEMLKGAFLNSLLLMGAALALALPLGILKGMADAWSSGRERSLGSFTSVLLLSVPDILWILTGYSLMIAVGSTPSLEALMPVPLLRGWILPLAVLTVMPAVYVSRVACVGFRHELNRPYIMALRARGASRGRIFLRHLLRPVAGRSLGALQSLVGVLVSNLIVVEYLFDYKGLANYILQADRVQDTRTFVSLVLALTVLYVSLALACTLLRRGTEGSGREGVR